MRSINLLPPEQAQAARRRRGIALGGLLGLGFLVLLGFLTLIWLGRAGEAEEAALDQRTRNTQIQAEINSLSEAQDVKIRYDGASSQIAEALTIDIAWASLLNDVGRVIPDRVWLGSMTATASPPNEEAEIPTFGSVQMDGTAFDYPDTATWLRTLDSAEWDAVGGAWVSDVSLGETEGFSTVDFSSAAILTGAALSDRAEERVPEVGE